jgi:integrase
VDRHRREAEDDPRSAQRPRRAPDFAEGRPLAPGHTFCSHLAMQGAPAKAIQEFAGHVNLSTTLRDMHLSPSAKDAAVRLLDRRPTGEDRGTTGAPEQAAETKMNGNA